MPHRNVDMVRATYESFNRWAAVRPLGSEPSVNADVERFLHPDVQFHAYTSAPEAGLYRGRHAVAIYHRRVFEPFESVRVEIEAVTDAGDHVVIESRQHTVPSGAAAEIVQHVVEVWTVRDGLLAERRTFQTRAEALEAVAARQPG